MAASLRVQPWLVLSMLAAAACGSFFMVASAGNFYNDVSIIWGEENTKIRNNGTDLTLSLDKSSGSGFQSKDEYLFAKIDMQLKLVPGNSAGTVTTYYLTSIGEKWDEIDFEFLGNETGEPYTLHTNVICQGKGNREQQFHLWFDPSEDFHTYTILWNPDRILFYVDDIPIREYPKLANVPFPENQAMRIYSTLWNADDWATQGGRVKTDWKHAPFVASYRNYNADACVWSKGASSCKSGGPSTGRTRKDWLWQKLSHSKRGQMKWVQDNYLIYDYCKDSKRFPQGLAPECSRGSK